MKDAVTIDSIESLYQALKGPEERKKQALFILKLRGWLTQSSSFDPVSGNALHTSTDDFMDAVTQSMQDQAIEGKTKDRVYRIVAHTKDAVLAIMKHTRDKILREHAMVPIHAAREVDTKSVQWLSRQPGRTLREKLSGKPYIKAVRRRSSVDTAENRLLKAFILRLERVLIERQNALPAMTDGVCEELLVVIQRWLRTDDAAEIGLWGNLPPNNTMLRDKRYRKVWDGWLWLQGIDERIITDRKRVASDILSVTHWNTLTLLNHTGRFRTVQQPVELYYDNFSLAPALPVRGYLFPARDSSIKGKIKNVNYEKNFGFLRSESGVDLFFHKSNLASTVDINSLKAGDDVSFVIGSNKQGECANDVTLATGIIPLEFSFGCSEWRIQAGNREVLVQIESNHFCIHQNNITQKKLELKPEMLGEVSKAIVSLITGFNAQPQKPESKQSAALRLKSSVVDLCAIRPEFTNQTGQRTLLPFRLLQQRWSKNDGSNHIVDCCTAKSIALHAGIETVSMRSLFLADSAHSDAVKRDASMFFANKLSTHIRADSLTYLVPDWGNEFEFEDIRKSINVYFEKSAPLPKSMAAIFAWQSSKKFEQNNIRENDFVLVVDSFDAGISITPVQARLQSDLDARLPEARHITWERHPTLIVPNRNIHAAMSNNLANDGCHSSEALIQWFGFEGLASDAGKLSFVNDEQCYHLPEHAAKLLNQNLDTSIFSRQTINDCLRSIGRDPSGVNKFILPIENTIKKPELDGSCHWLGSAWSPIKGGQVLNEWQKRAEDITLWRDHLPELSIRIRREGQWHFENFYLVKDATVTPQRGRTVDIPVAESFTLSAGQTHYSFPLQQGEGNKKMRFVAYLKSRTFPLKEAVTCKLKMTYTYGADDPYELQFVPIDSEEAGFKSIRVEWRSASESEIVDLDNLPVPDFPARNSWFDFQNFPKGDGKSFSDLLEWLERDMKKIGDIARYGRVTGAIPKWIDKGNENIFCFVNDVFIHKSSLGLSSGQELPQPGETLSFYKLKGEQGKFFAEDVVIGDSQPTKCFLSASLRFPTFTIWNHGRNLLESDVPERFRSSMFEGIKNALSLIESENTPDSLKEELLFFLSCIHQDAPEDVGARLIEAVQDNKLFLKYQRNIAFAIGSADLIWQQELLNRITYFSGSKGLTRSIAMETLAIALWRSQTLINKLKATEIDVLAKNLYECLEFDFQAIANDGKVYQTATLCKHLELLLAILRSRKNRDESCKTILSPDKDLTKNYVGLVNDISKALSDTNIELKSRISLQIDKPEMFKNMPDILYALRLYLTNSSGSNTITITGVVED